METKVLQPKVEAIYQAVFRLFAKGADLNNLTVSEITAEAGIGKGTAYEYFANKEEMIAGAIHYKMQEVCGWLYDNMSRAQDFYGKMQMLFNCMEEQLTEVNCICRVMHLMADHSAVSKKLKELADSRTQEAFGVTEMIRKILLDENEDKKFDEETQDYLTLAICSKLLCYAMFLSGAQDTIHISQSRMKQMICEDICRQMEYCKAGS